MAASAQKQAITEVLGEVCAGVPGAMDRLVPMVYADLERIAHRQLGLEPPGHTYSTRELVHEAYLRLVDQSRARWADRSHFYAVAATVMRRVLVDHARRYRAARRGGGRAHTISLETLETRDPAALSPDERADVLIAVDAALQQLAVLDERQAQVVAYRFFGGLTEAETAAALRVAERTVARDWVKARGWLYRVLSGDAP